MYTQLAEKNTFDKTYKTNDTKYTKRNWDTLGISSSGGARRRGGSQAEKGNCAAAPARAAEIAGVVVGRS